MGNLATDTASRRHRRRQQSRRLLVLLLSTGLLGAAGAQAGNQGVGSGKGKGAAGEMQVICHTPPGNPDNPQTISVGASAVAAHVAHGDELGACDQAAGEPVMGAAVTFTVCDDRSGETGRTISLSGIGRLSTAKIACD